MADDRNWALPTIGEAQWRAVLDEIPARLALIDRDRLHRYVNREYLSFFGRTADEVLGQHVAEVIGTGAFQRLANCGARALAGETVRWEGDLDYGPAHGTRFVQQVYVPYRGDGRAIEGYFTFARDLTALKQREVELAAQVEALHASEAVNAAITASALDCIVVIDGTGAVVGFNPAAEVTFGYRESDVLGRPIGELIVPPHLRQSHADGFARYLRTRQPHLLGRRIEIEAMHAGGRLFPVELTINEVPLAGRLLFTAYLRDLSSAKAARAEIERQREVLHQTEKLAALGSLLAGVAHELNNPLSLVVGNALMLQEEVEPGSALASRAEKISVAADRCARTVRSFLGAARQRRSQRALLDIDDVLDGVLDVVGDAMGAAAVAIERIRSQEPLPVEGDSDQLHQLLTNLLVNARHAMESQPQPRRIGIATRRRGGLVEIEIADTGPGVPPAIRGRIFEPLFTTKPAGSGSGIGLAIARGVAEAHSGTLLLVERETPGACFLVGLPAADR